MGVAGPDRMRVAIPLFGTRVAPRCLTAREMVLAEVEGPLVKKGVGGVGPRQLLQVLHQMHQAQVLLLQHGEGLLLRRQHPVAQPFQVAAYAG